MERRGRKVKKTTTTRRRRGRRRRMQFRLWEKKSLWGFLNLLIKEIQ